MSEGLVLFEQRITEDYDYGAFSTADYLGMPLVYNDYLDSTQTSVGIRTSNPLLKYAGKMVSSRYHSSKHLTLSSTFQRAGSGRKWRTVAMYEQELPRLNFLVLI